MKTGLVLEGGAMRGLFTCGVMDVLLEHQITFDGAIGVSAGACFGVNYKSRQIGRAIRYNLKYINDDRYGTFSSLLHSGNMFDAQFAYHDMTHFLDPFDFETFIKNPMEFYCVATDLDTGKPVYHKMVDAHYHDLEWVRASSSMPLVSQVVEIDGYRLLDGGIADAIPLSYMETLGYDRNVVILTQPKGYVKERNKLIPLMAIKYKNDPHLIEDMESRHYRYNQLTQDIYSREEKGELFVIAPPAPLHIPANTKERSELIRVYECGRQDANMKLEALKQYLKGNV